MSTEGEPMTGDFEGERKAVGAPARTWRTDPDAEQQYIYGGTGEVVAVARPEDAALIVAAVNAHDAAGALADAVEGFRDSYSRDSISYDPDMDGYEIHSGPNQGERMDGILLSDAYIRGLEGLVIALAAYRAATGEDGTDG